MSCSLLDRLAKNARMFEEEFIWNVKVYEECDAPIKITNRRSSRRKAPQMRQTVELMELKKEVSEVQSVLKRRVAFSELHKEESVHIRNTTL